MKSLSLSGVKFDCKPLQPFGIHLSREQGTTSFEEMASQDLKEIVEAVRENLLIVIQGMTMKRGQPVCYFKRGKNPPTTVFPHIDQDAEQFKVHILTSCRGIRSGRRARTAYATVQSVNEIMRKHAEMLKDEPDVYPAISGKADLNPHEIVNKPEDVYYRYFCPPWEDRFIARYSNIFGFLCNKKVEDLNAQQKTIERLLTFTTLVQDDLEESEQVHHHSWQGKGRDEIVLSDYQNTAHNLPFFDWAIARRGEPLQRNRISENEPGEYDLEFK